MNGTCRYLALAALAALPPLIAACGGGGGGDSDPATPTPPTAQLSAGPADLLVGQYSKLTWSSTNADRCTASGAWNGERATQGDERVGPIAADSRFSISCSGAGGTADAGTTLRVVGWMVAPGAVLSAEVTDAQVILRWTDALSDESGYTVETSAAEGNWQHRETLAPSAGAGTKYQWQTAVAVRTRLRVRADGPTERYPMMLETRAQTREYMLEVDPANGGVVELDRTEPLEGSVEVGIRTTGKAPKAVDYSLDLSAATARVTQPPDFPWSWDSRQVTDGVHRINARLDYPDGVYVHLRRTVQVDNPALQGDLLVRGQSNEPTRRVYVVARSDVRLTSVTFLLDERQMAQLFAPNACTAHFCEQPNAYLWEWPVAAYASGTHRLRAEVRDEAAKSLTLTEDHALVKSPAVTLLEPEDGALVGDTLVLRGSALDDVGGLLSVATLGATEILRLSNPQFAVNYDMSGLPDGAYTLRLLARNDAGTTELIRRVLHSRSASQRFKPLFSVGGNGAVHAVEDGTILYTADEAAKLHRADGTTTTVAEPLPQYARNFVLSQGRVAYDAKPDATGYRVLLWDNGVTTRYGSGQYNQEPKLNWPWMLYWSNGVLRLANLRTPTETTIPPPPGATAILNTGYALFVDTPNATSIFYPALTGPSGTSAYDLFRYHSASASTLRITADGGTNVAPGTDGMRVVWRRGPEASVRLLAGPYSNPTAAVPIADPRTSSAGFLVDGGYVAYVQSELAGASVMLLTPANETLRLSPANQYSRLLDLSGDRVLFTVGDETRLWQNGVTSTIFPARSYGFLDGRILLVSGENGTVYVER